MLRYILRRLPATIVVLLISSVAIFVIIRLAPGDPATLVAGPDADDQTIAAIRSELGLDKPLVVQYLTWLGGVLTGNLGTSYLLQAPISELIGQSLGNTIMLATAATIIAVIGGGIVGYIMGTTRSSFLRTALSGVNSLGIAVPTYVTGVLLVLVFAVTWRILPPGGMGPGLRDFSLGWQYLLMPAIALSLPTAATLARFLAASLRQTLGQDFVQTGIAKGLRNRRLIGAHVLPNSLPPVITVLGLQIGQMLGGAIIIETIFAWPGIGQLLLQAVNGNDYLLTQALLLIAVAVFIIVQLVNDVVDAAMDPRIRLELK
ncbi:ABC transporter permease [Microbacterium soli]|uniref:Glutathione ABC transporter permease GsiC n=1 Tax=Microbacterium soli TaxID=446075 RepID=A0ABP7N5L9_9MICO